MSTRKLGGVAILFLFAAALAFILLHPAAPPTPPSAPPPNSSAAATQSGVISPAAPDRTIRPDLLKDPSRATVVPRTADGFVEWTESITAAKTLNSPERTGDEDITIVRTLLTDYHAVFKENPPGGENVEITRALLGDNPKKIRFLAQEKTLLDAEGALIDRWGQPYFFHKLSRDTMDLRSAGPDRKMFTPDDLLDESPGNRPPL